LPLNEMLEKIGCELGSSDETKDKVPILEAMKKELKELKNPSPAQLKLRKAWMSH